MLFSFVPFDKFLNLYLRGCGVVHVAEADATRWRRAGEVPGAPQAFDVSADGWHVATTDGIHRSIDEGRTWSRVIEAETG